MENVLTLIASPEAPLIPGLVADIRGRLEALGAETARPAWLAPDIACDIDFDLLSNDQAEAAARGLLAGLPVDVLAQPRADRRKRLLLIAADDDAAEFTPVVRAPCRPTAPRPSLRSPRTTPPARR